MNRRSFLSALIAAPGLAAALVACGDPDRASVATEPSTPGTTPGTTPVTEPGTAPANGITHPTGADDVIVRIGYQGGLVPMGYAFVDTPALLVSGDGRVFTPGVVPAVFPGPLLPVVNVRTIDEAGVQAMLGIVDRSRLLSDLPDYTGGTNVADAPETVLTINANGKSYVRSAYALGIDSPESSARQTLLDAITALTDVDKAAGTSNLGTNQPFVATMYRLQARRVAESEITGQDPPVSIFDWPAETGVSLASAVQCARVDAAKVGSLFINAKQNTLFKEGGVVYQLSVVGVLPGDPAC